MPQLSSVASRASAPLLACLYLGILAGILASFPMRNADVWQHLANGRVLRFSGTWLYDLGSYVINSVGGSRAILAVKTLCVALTSVLIYLLSWDGRGWRIALATTTLAVLAIGSRVLPQPQTVSYLFFALLLWLWCALQLNRRMIYIITLGVVWSFVHHSVFIGAALLFAALAGRRLDRQGEPIGRQLVFGTGILILLAIYAIGVGSLFTSDASAVQSPFGRDYLMLSQDSPTTLAFFPLLLLGLASFLLNRTGWRWEWFLPFVGMAILASVQARAIPYFAIVAGPILAWNLQGWFTHRHPDAPTPIGQTTQVITTILTGLLGIGFLISAWTGWLQGPPYGARSWASDLPPGIEASAKRLAEWHASQRVTANTRTLHVSPDTAAGFAWFCPRDEGLIDSELSQQLGKDDLDSALRAKSIRRVVVWIGDRRLRPGLLEQLLDDPDRWPLLSLVGGVAIFGWTDPQAAPETLPRFTPPDPARPLDSADYLSRSGPNTTAPHWSEVFRTAPPMRSADRDQAAFLLMLGSAQQRRSGFDHLVRWQLQQGSAMMLASGSIPHLGMAVDLGWRSNLFFPPLPPNGSPPSQLTSGLRAIQSTMAARHGDVAPEIVYTAIRTARRAVAANPGDGQAYYVLAQAYQLALNDSVERYWATQLPQLARLREVQISAALARAAKLSPRSPTIRTAYARQLQKLNCQDVAIGELKAVQKLVGRSDELAKELEFLDKRLADSLRDFQRESERVSVVDRATLAAQRGLAGHSLDILLGSDFAAFGVNGMKLEIDLLLRTGQSERLRNWATNSPEWSGSLGAEAYHWLLVQVAAAEGDYETALQEMIEMVSGDDGLLVDKGVVMTGLTQLYGRSVAVDSIVPTEWSSVAIQAIGRDSFTTGMSRSLSTLSHQADVVTLRGLLAFECGELETARLAFMQVLTYFGGRPIEFGAKPIALKGQEWLRRVSER